MRIPTFSRQSGTTRTAGDEPTLVDTPAVPAHQRDERSAAGRADETTVSQQPVTVQRHSTGASGQHAVAEPGPPPRTDRVEHDRATARPATDPTIGHADPEPAGPPVIAGPRPRASLLATLGLITGVVSALFVLSGPLVGYGIGLAVLALVLSLGGISATGRRHVAGKSDAIIGLLLALGAIVLGVLALTGSLSWLGTDTEPVNRLREWLDTQFVERF